MARCQRWSVPTRPHSVSAVNNACVANHSYLASSGWSPPRAGQVGMLDGQLEMLLEHPESRGLPAVSGAALVRQDAEHHRPGGDDGSENRGEVRLTLPSRLSEYEFFHSGLPRYSRTLLPAERAPPTSASVGVSARHHSVVAGVLDDDVDVLPTRGRRQATSGLGSRRRNSFGHVAQSKLKIRLQSSFMLTTVHPRRWASTSAASRRPIGETR